MTICIICHLHIILNVRGQCKRVPAIFLTLLEEINKRLPRRLLGHIFWDLFDSLAVADKCLGVIVLLLANEVDVRRGELDDIGVNWRFNTFSMADKCLGIVVLLLANGLGINGGILL